MQNKIIYMFLLIVCFQVSLSAGTINIFKLGSPKSLKYRVQEERQRNTKWNSFERIAEKTMLGESYFASIEIGENEKIELYYFKKKGKEDIRASVEIYPNGKNVSVHVSKRIIDKKPVINFGIFAIRD